MKRKSQQIPTNIARSLKKNKTQGNTRKKQILKDANSHRWSEIIVQQIINELSSQTYKKIKGLAHEQLINSIMTSCQFMSQNLSELLCPQINQKQQCSIIMDKQPIRVAYDPICGFDKLITLKNDNINKINENILNQSKLKGFGVYQTGKKIASKTGSIISSTSKLVPLQTINNTIKQTKSQKQQQKQQSFLRDRIFDSGLPTLNVPQIIKKQQNKSINKHKSDKISKILIQSQDYMYDYNGQKTILTNPIKLNNTNTSLIKQTKNNILKTTCRILDHIGIDQKKKYSLIKDRSSRLSNVFQLRRMSKEIIKNPNIKTDQLNQLDNSILKSGIIMDQGQVIKNILEASFREKDVICRPIEKTSRHSKIL